MLNTIFDFTIARSKNKSSKIFLRLKVWKLYKKTIINNFCQFPEFDSIFDMTVEKGSDQLGQNRW